MSNPTQEPEHEASSGAQIAGFGLIFFVCSVLVLVVNAFTGVFPAMGKPIPVGYIFLGMVGSIVLFIVGALMSMPHVRADLKESIHSFIFRDRQTASSAETTRSSATQTQYNAAIKTSTTTAAKTATAPRTVNRAAVIKTAAGAIGLALLLRRLLKH